MVQKNRLYLSGCSIIIFLILNMPIASFQTASKSPQLAACKGNPPLARLLRTPIAESPNRRIAESPSRQFATPPNRRDPDAAPPGATNRRRTSGLPPPPPSTHSRWHRACDQARDLCRQLRALGTAPFSNAEP